MNLTDHNIEQISFEPPEKYTNSKKKAFLCIVISLAIIFTSISIINAPKGAVREIQQIYKKLGGTNEFVTIRVQEESGLRITTNLLFKRSLFSASKITTMGSVSTSGLIIMAGIEIQGDAYSWYIESMYDGERYGSGGKTGMQKALYTGTLAPGTFYADSPLPVGKNKYDDPISEDFRRFLFKYGPQLMTKSLSDLDVLMKVNGTYSVYDLGFKKFK